MFTMLGLLVVLSTNAQVTPKSQMEHLDRSPVALRAQEGGIFVSWRLLGTEDAEATTFDVLAGNIIVARDLANTNFVHTTGTTSREYRIVTKVNGIAVDTTAAIKPWSGAFKQLKLNRPATGPNGGTYSPNDCSVGDVDGDGQYELFVKWDPSNQKDNSQGGITDNVFIDCYRLTGEQLWRIDLGRNIRAGAHYTQFMVYDFDGDGRAELMCKTGPGSLDAKGNYVNAVATDASIKSVSGTALFRTNDGRITGGQEWLTVFHGTTGEAVHTIFYNPNRNTTYGGAADGSFNWDDRSGHNDKASYGNRGERYLAAVAYLDGPDAPPSGIFSRGYYTFAYVWAVNFDGKQLHQRWLHASNARTSYKLTTYDASGKGTTKTYSNLPPSTSGGGSRTLYGNGNHNLSVADVDGDGCDEIIWGSSALDHDGKLLYAVGFGHGDAIHLADMNPDRPGLELFDIHEEKGTYAWDLHDARTGEVLFKGGPSGVDNGRGMAAQLDSRHRGYYFSSAKAGEQRSAVTGNVISNATTSMNFRIYWDGDLQDELLNGNRIDKWNGGGVTTLFSPADYNQSQTCNSSKATPNLSADLFGDWREEVIYWSKTDYATLNIFTTNIPSDYMIPTLMHDHTYRMGICWQNTAYNQPPHLGYYLPDYAVDRAQAQLIPLEGTLMEQTVSLGDSIRPIVCRWTNCSSKPAITSTAPDGTKKYLSNDLPGFTNTIDVQTNTLSIIGKPEMTGNYTFSVRLKAQGKTAIDKIIKVHVVQADGIRDIRANENGNDSGNVNGSETYDLLGRRQPDGLSHGLNIIKESYANGRTAHKVYMR